MRIAAGTKLGSYEIRSELGAGGMGVVYRARDTRLGRDVAIKVLPDAFTSDVERLQRFEQEARMLAALNHPHIGAIYGVEEGERLRGLVLELVEGPTLADRLMTGPLAIGETLAIARQIADALDAAHEKGIVHRDLKPANIKVTADGIVKVLDFGLAKAAASDGPEAEIANSPTVTAVGTRDGVIFGTAAYMSPEQARGKLVDKRTDIWAFGCVVYEMLTGHAAFSRETVSDIVVAILEREPDWHALPETTPPTIRRLMQRCLEKDPKRRLRDIADARAEIEDAIGDRASAVAAHDRGLPSPAAHPRQRRQRLWIVAVALVLVAGAVTFTFDYWRRPAVTNEAVRFVVLPPEGNAFGEGVTDRNPTFAISPDGRRLVFLATHTSRRSQLWVRTLASLEAEPLAGTEGASFPFWSSDSTQVAFFAQGKLKRVSLAGGAPIALADARPGVGGTWNRAGVILFAREEQGPLFRVSDAGGATSAVTALAADRDERAHLFPQFLPDGRHFIYLVRAQPPHGGIYLSSIDNSAPTRLLSTDQQGKYAPPGHLLFLRDGALMAQPFDATSRELSGDPLPIVESVAFSTTNGRSAYSVSDNGVLAYRPSGIPATTQPVWTDRSGKKLSVVGKLGDYQTFRLSPDESRVAAELHDLRTGTGDLWLLDLKRGSASRLTFDGTHNNAAVWSPDGTQIVYTGRPSGAWTLFSRLVSSVEADEPLLPPGPVRSATDWSPDGRYILFQQDDPKTQTDLWVLEMPARKAVPYLQTEFNERLARFSPDGRWVAYMSNESGRYEVYVRPFPSPHGKWQISIDGGGGPQWRGDGRELVYRDLNDTFMAVSVKTTPQFDPGIPRALFTARLRSQEYSMSKDGERFLLNLISPDPALPAPPITVVINWTTMLEK